MLYMTHVTNTPFSQKTRGIFHLNDVQRVGLFFLAHIPLFLKKYLNYFFIGIGIT